MSSVNKAIVLGRLGQDPEIKYTAAGDAVVNLSVATSESWKDKATGEKKEQTEWHRISIFGKPAEIAAQYLKKGSLVYVEAKMRTRKFTDKQGVERASFELLSDSFKMIGSPPDGARQDSPKLDKPRQAAPSRDKPVDDMNADDIPF